ncbi:MAG: zinc-ribbon domain-containing protein [Planctomycetota bacterium]
MKDYFVCPNCGAEVSPKALACPECGADDQTGWSEDTLYDGTGIEFFDEPEPEEGASLFMNNKFLIIIAFIAIVLFLVFVLR